MTRIMDRPTPEKIRATRKELALTQTQAASLIYRTLNAWQRWEDGSRNMPLPLWELFLHKTGKQ